MWHKWRVLLAVAVILGGSIMSTVRAATKLQPVPFMQVEIHDEFWAPKLQTVLKDTLPHCFEQCDITGRLSNFDKAAGVVEGEFAGYFFNDSDVYKVIEGAAYALMHERDAELEAYVDDLIARIATAQAADGYLNSYFALTPGEERWTNCRVRHELYCAGHLLEAAIAYHQATGKRALLDVAVDFIAHIETVFGPGKRSDVPGHEEIELALVRLYHLTGEQRYLKLAEFFVERRGRAEGRELYGEYCQDHAPVREHTHIVGHAVRAMYLYCGVADLAAVNGDAGYIEMMERVWGDTVNKKMYVTGGIGTSRDNEGFTEAYDLPNESAYCETCAAIALCLWNQRLNLLHADAKYFDVFERTLYNGLLAGIALDGKRFFYVNPLVSDGSHHRQPWYPCACCPSNIVRFVPSVGGYVYAQTDNAIYVNLYVGSAAEVELRGDRRVRVEQETRYPWDGRVKLRVTPDGPQAFDLHLRVPAWCQTPRLQFNGTPVEPVVTERGYARLTCAGQRGYTVELDLPMPIVRMRAHPNVEADRGRVALQRGPIVYCLEAADTACDVRALALSRDAQLTSEFRGDLLGGVTTIRGAALVAEAGPGDDWEQPLYERAPRAVPVAFEAVPYYAWDNRESGAMVVWLPESLTLVPRPGVSWVRASASHCWREDTLGALHDRRTPRDSGDHDAPRFSWWPRRGTAEWVQYDFDQPRRVDSVAVYWFDDSQKRGGCRGPATWNLLHREGQSWKRMSGVSDFGVELDQFNHVSFDAVMTDALRIEVQLQEGMSAGILEWKVGSTR